MKIEDIKPDDVIVRTKDKILFKVVEVTPDRQIMQSANGKMNEVFCIFEEPQPMVLCSMDDYEPATEEQRQYMESKLAAFYGTNPEVESKRITALASIMGDIKQENIELAERVKQLMSDYNKVVKQLQAETENPIVTTDLDIDCCDFCILSQGRVYEGNEHLLGTKNKPEVKMKLIDEKRLAELLISEACLELLERNNVDEWDYYEESLRNEVTDGLSYYEYVNQPISEITKDYKTV